MGETKRRILVIDDERGIRSLCGDVLRRAGYETEVAETGEAGLAAAAQGCSTLAQSSAKSGRDGF